MKQTTKRIFAIVLAAMMLTGLGGAALFASAMEPIPAQVYFAAPETIYVNPSNGQTQYFANNWSASKIGPGWEKPADVGAVPNQTSGYVHFNCAGATDVKIYRDSIVPGTQQSATALTEVYAGYTQADPLATGNGDVNATLSSGTATTGSGLIKWRADFTLDGVGYTTYAYSYLYRPARVIVGGMTRTCSYDAHGVQLSNFRHVQATAGLYVAGMHQGQAARYVTIGETSGNSNYNPPSPLVQGNYSPSANLQSAMYPGNNAPPVGLGAGKPAVTTYVGSFGSAVAYGRDDRNLGTMSGAQASFAEGSGQGMIYVDSSRYSNLSQIPQLIAGYRVIENDRTTYQGNAAPDANPRGYRVKVSGSAGTGTDTLPGSGVTAGIGSFTSQGDFYSADLNYAAAPTSWWWTGRPFRALANPSNYSSTGFLDIFGYFWQNWYCNYMGKNSYYPQTHRDNARLNYALYNKENLRNVLRGVTKECLNGDDLVFFDEYQAVADKAAQALCQPNFVLSDPANQLASAGNPGSLVSEVVAAREKCVPSTYFISYDANGGIGAPEPQIKDYFLPLAIPAQEPVREGYSFAGWARNRFTNIPEFQPEGAFMENENTVFYAVWHADMHVYRFHPGDGGAPIVRNARYDSMLNIMAIRDAFPSRLSSPRGNRVLLGWSHTGGAIEAAYVPDAVVQVMGNADFYAVWAFLNEDVYETNESVKIVPATAFDFDVQMAVELQGEWNLVELDAGWVLSYDISFHNDDVAGIQPRHPVTVYLSLPQEFIDKGGEPSLLTLTHYHDNGPGILMPFTAEEKDGRWYIVFETDLFSVFELKWQAQAQGAPAAPAWNGQSKTVAYKKGDTLSLAVPEGVVVKEWKTSNAKTAAVANGTVALGTRGSATITAVLEDDTAWTYNVTVNFNFWQWLLYIFCFGWIWMK